MHPMYHCSEEHCCSLLGSAACQPQCREAAFPSSCGVDEVSQEGCWQVSLSWVLASKVEG